MKIEDTKVIYIKVPEELHKEIKKHAVVRNVSMKHWIMSAIIDKLNSEKEVL